MLGCTLILNYKIGYIWMFVHTRTTIDHTDEALVYSLGFHTVYCMFRTPINNLFVKKKKKVFDEGLEGCVWKSTSDVTPEGFLYLKGLLRLFPQGKMEESEWYWLTGGWLTMIDSWVHFRVGKRKSYALCWTPSFILIMSDLAVYLRDKSFTCMTFN